MDGMDYAAAAPNQFPSHLHTGVAYLERIHHGTGAPTRDCQRDRSHEGCLDTTFGSHTQTNAQAALTTSRGGLRSGVARSVSLGSYRHA
jgi:hypothetical protein